MNRSFLTFPVLATLFVACALQVNAAETRTDEARLLRFPTVGGGNIVFSYAGNLYRVADNGGAAVKLTSHVGYECFPKISPDGQTIAFTAQYDGNTEVYTMPVTGGEPKRVTFTALVARDNVGERMGPNNIVMGWTPDGKGILFRNKQWCFSGLRAQLCVVPAEGGTPTEIPTSEGGFSSFSPDGKQLAMNRMFREFRTWKYYRGGQADDIWIHKMGTTDIERIPGCDPEAQDIFPMWIGDEIYYFSDRDHVMNLFVYNTKTQATRKVTDFTEYDCKFPSCSQQDIVFENGGYIWKYNVKAAACTKVPVTLADDDLYSRSEQGNASGSISSASLSPDGKQVVAVGRGDIFLLPAEKGPVTNVSRSPQSHEREAEWSPDGKHIAWFSDASGEYQVWMAPADDFTKAESLTDFTTGYPSNLQWSPDSKKLYFNTDCRDVYELPLGGKAKRILVGEESGIRNFTLSTDGKWAAYTTSLPNRISAVFLYDVEAGKSYQVTDRWYDAAQPLFSQDGKYLFFTSSRDFRAQYSRVEWNTSYSVQDYIFVLPLAAGTVSPTMLRTDFDASDVKGAPEMSEGPKEGPKDGPEGPKGPKDGKKDAKKADKKADKPAVMKVDIDGMGQRICCLSSEAGNFRLIAAVNGKLYYSSFGGGRSMGPGGPSGGSGVKEMDLNTLKVSDSPMGSPMFISADFKKAIVRDGSNYMVTNFGAPAKGGAAIPTADMDMVINREAEWKQIFDESWRVTRDGFYVENMHGADWQHVHDKYAEMLPYVKHRDDLTYLIGEMLGELNVGHAYITSGEKPAIPRVTTGLLGAKFSRDAATGAFRIEKIFRGADWDSSLRSPLTAPGVDVKVGEYITKVNGLEAASLTDVGEALVGKANKTVSLVIASDAKGKGARTVYVKPIESEIQLAYYEWVQRNIAIVDELSDGEIGYIHIPDMSIEGLDMFTKMFYTQFDKRALIVDDRMNGGGNVSPIILERLQREVYRVSMGRNYSTEPVPNETFYGPKVCLIDKYSSSDGDLFPYSFRQLGLGKLIGKRSWGGIVGISGSKPFVDGQDMRTPFFTSYSTEGEWIIEGHGVDPDIEVDINPFEDYLGTDAQLQKAVEVLKEELKDWNPLPGIPEAPVKM